MPDEFPYDVFLSHSSKDKAVVRPLAERLRLDGRPTRPRELPETDAMLADARHLDQESPFRQH